MESGASRAEAIETLISDAGTPERALKEKAYLKSALHHIGAPVPAIRKAVAKVVPAKAHLDGAALRTLVDALYSRGVHELRFAAIVALEIHHASLEADDWRWLEGLLREAKTWALLDPLAINVIGKLIRRAPQLANALDAWAIDDDFWLRRAAMLSLLLPLRHGEGDFERFARYADKMLDEKEFFIRKAIGWILRETSKKRPALVLSWIMPRDPRLSGVTRREAVKYLSAKDRALLANASAAGD